MSQHPPIGVSSNGRTWVFESHYRGSNPRTPITLKRKYKMNANEYQSLAMRTAAGSRQHGDLNAIAVMALGICGESAELLTDGADYDKELGDCWWYAAVLAELIDTKLEDYIHFTYRLASEKELFLSAGRIADYVKKIFGHGHTIDKQKLQDLLRAYIHVLVCLSGMGNMHKIWEANIEKLRKRYPDGFSSERSQNRTE
jgi:NTP pyrophosphatase (non-canonical NTP hydrolase)